MATAKLTKEDLAEALADWERFEAGFQRGKKRGSLWRDYDGRRLSVFYRRGGGFCFSIADEDGVRFGPVYDDEEGALAALWEAVRGY